jgi:hypothetical protein
MDILHESLWKAALEQLKQDRLARPGELTRLLAQAKLPVTQPTSALLRY